jgi:hypothetical protein
MAAAARVVPAVSRSLPIFTGGKKEDLQEFINLIDHVHQRERVLYDDDAVPGARRALLVEGCRGKVATFIKGLSQDKKDTYETLVASLREKYEAPNTQDQARAFRKAMKAKQRHDEDLMAYAKRVKKIVKKLDPAWNQLVAEHFVEGIRNRNLRTIVAACGQKADCTFKEIYEATKSVARARKHGSDSDSDTSTSDSDSDSSDAASSGSSRHGSAKKKTHHGDPKRTQGESKEKGRSIEITPQPVAPAIPAFSMEALAKAVADALQTRNVATPLNPFTLPQPPQLVDSYAVTSGRQYQGNRSYGYQDNQSSGNHGYQGNQSFGSRQPGPPFGAPQSQYSRQATLVCYNCEERGHGYQSCPRPPQPDEARRAIYERVNADRPWPYANQNQNQHQNQQQPQQQQYQDRYQRPAFMNPAFSTQDVRSSDPQPEKKGGSSNPSAGRISEVNLVEEMQFGSSALDGIVVEEKVWIDEVSMIEEIYAVEKRKATQSGPDSEASDPRVTKKVTPLANTPVSTDPIPTSVAGPSTSILERPRAVAYSKTVERPVEKSGVSGQTKIMKKQPEPAGVIRMMVGKPEFDFVSSLRDTAVAGMTWGDLFVLAPRVKRDVARQLVQERKASSKGKEKQKRSVSFVEEVAECHQVEVARPTAMGMGRALAEDPLAVTNFYTVGKVNLAPCQTLGPFQCVPDVTVYSIAKILVDSGSVLNLMPEYFARHLGFHLSPTKSLMMRTAAAEVSVIQWYVDVDIEIAGVISTSRVYCVPAPARPSYTLLLGRKWMKQVRAIGNYETGTYLIRDSLGKEYTVTAQAAPASVRAEVPVISMCQEMSDDDDLDEDTRLELELGPEGYADALLRQVEVEAEEEMAQYGIAGDEDGYAGDEEVSDDEVYVNEAGNASRH